MLLFLVLGTAESIAIRPYRDWHTWLDIHLRVTAGMGRLSWGQGMKRKARNLPKHPVGSANGGDSVA